MNISQCRWSDDYTLSSLIAIFTCNDDIFEYPINRRGPTIYRTMLSGSTQLADQTQAEREQKYYGIWPSTCQLGGSLDIYLPTHIFLHVNPMLNFTCHVYAHVLLEVFATPSVETSEQCQNCDTCIWEMILVLPYFEPVSPHNFLEKYCND